MVNGNFLKASRTEKGRMGRMGENCKFGGQTRENYENAGLSGAGSFQAGLNSHTRFEPCVSELLAA